MRFSVVFGLLAVVGGGCDSGGGSGGAMDLSMKLTADMTLPPANCDTVAQDCGSGKKCVGQADSSGNISGTCVSDGTVALGGTCTQQMSQDTFLDNCKAGGICDDLFGNSTLACHKMCAKDSDCTNGDKCGDFTFGSAPFGWCVTSCTPFAAAGAGGCSGTDQCAENIDDMDQPDANAEAGYFFCKKTGTGAAFDPCGSDADCGPNTWCGPVDMAGTINLCIPNCTSTVNGGMCPTPPGDAGPGGLGATCHVLTGAPNMSGYCYVM